MTETGEARASLVSEVGLMLALEAGEEQGPLSVSVVRMVSVGVGLGSLIGVGSLTWGEGVGNSTGVDIKSPMGESDSDILEKNR